MTLALLLTTLALILVSPFAGLPGLAGMTAAEVYAGWAIVLTIIGIWEYADLLGDGNVERLERMMG